MGLRDELGDASAAPSLVPIHHGDSTDADAAVAEDVATLGAACRPGVIGDRLVDEFREFVDRAVSADLAWHDPNDHENTGRVTFLPRYGALPLGLLEDDGVMGPVVELLGSATEMYTMTTACQEPGQSGRAIHVDALNQPTGFVLALGVLVLLDDFDELSGPTRFYPGVTPNQPTQADYDARAIHLHATAGSVCWFNAGLWHDVLPNRSTSPRRSILIAMGRSGLRARFDMVRMLSHLDIDDLSPTVKRRLGLLNLPPGSYEEYYLPDGERQEAILRAAINRC